MKEKKVGDVMTPNPITVHRDTSVKELAKIMVDNDVGGLPVVDDEGLLVGIVTRGDLIVQDAHIHFPTFIHFLDSYIFLPGSLKKYERELSKAVGAKVEDLMTEEVVTATRGMTVYELATLMHEKDLKRLPVVDDGKLIGIISRADIVQLIWEGASVEGAGESSD